MPQDSDLTPPDQEAIEAVLDAFINAKTWQAKIAIIEAREALLLSRDAFKTLHDRIAHSRIGQGNPEQTTEKLEYHLRFLEDTKKWGTTEAFLQHMIREKPFLGKFMKRINRDLRKKTHLVIRTALQNPDGQAALGSEFFHLFHSNTQLAQEVMPLLLESLQQGGLEAAMEVTTLLEPFLKDTATIETNDIDRAVLAQRITSLEQRLNQSDQQPLPPIWRAFLKITLVNDLCTRSLTQPQKDIQGVNPQQDELQEDSPEPDQQRAVKFYAEVLDTLSSGRAPLLLAMIQYRLGSTYYHLLHSSHASEAYIVHAIGFLRQAISVFDSTQQFALFVEAQEMLGNIRTLQFHAHPIKHYFEQAISHYDAILQISVQDISLADRARTYYNMGMLYLAYQDIPNEREQTKYLEQAVTCYDQALEFYTRDFLVLHRDIQSNKALALEALGRFQEAHTCLSAARDVMRDLFAQGMMEHHLAEFIAEQARFNIYLRDAALLVRHNSPDWKQVVLTLEDGRTQAQRVALNLDALIMEQRADLRGQKLVTAFKIALDAWRDAQRKREAPLPAGQESMAEQKKRRQHLEKTYTAFTRARDLLCAYDPHLADFLPQEPTFESISEAVKSEREALVYLAACLDDGMALIVTRDKAGTADVQYVKLPQLTLENILVLFRNSEESSTQGMCFDGGYFLAQANQGFLCLQDWGESLTDALKHLSPQSGLALAAGQLRENWEKQSPELLALFDMPFDQPFLKENSEEAFIKNRFTRIFNQAFLDVELRRSLGSLGPLGLNAVAEKLQRQGIQRVAIVPYGYLGNFPLSAIEISTSASAQNAPTQLFGSLFEVTITPSARSLAVARRRAAATASRGTRSILAVGNPLPLPKGEGFIELPFAAVEAENTRLIAATFKQGPVCWLTGEQAYKAQVKKEIANSWLVHLSCHGQYRPEAPWQSRLILAARAEDGAETDHYSITVDECLRGHINLKQVRLLILSACETSAIDILQAADEMIGLAASFFQAGATGVIAASWPVDEKATCLLITRFMELYLNPQHRDRPPAYCLERAQHWLRQEATHRVLAMYYPVSSMKEGLVDLASSQLSEPQRQAIRDIRRINAAQAASNPQGLPYAAARYWAAFTLIGL